MNVRRIFVTKRHSFLAAVVASVVFSGVLAGVVQRPAGAAVVSLNGYACGYFTDVSLFGGPNSTEGCGQPPTATATSASPEVTLPPGGSDTPVIATKPEGAQAKYGPATLFGGIWEDDVAQPSPSGRSR